ncbi:MAG: hypothetical protein ACR2O0_05305, partial [Rhizobiaceae bacterium]
DNTGQPDALRMTLPRAALAIALSIVMIGCQTSSSFRPASVDQPAWSGPQSGLLAPFKEAQFKYRPPLEVADGGAYLKIPYDELKDINDRDEIPVRKVRSWWVRRLPKDAEKELEFKSPSGTHKYKAIGRLDGNSKMTVIYVHGRGGNRLWGFDDERFGGNFNRLKNMLLKAGGTYISTDFTDFESTGFSDVSALIRKYRPLTKGKLVVACGSMGNFHCWNMFQNSATASRVDGVIILAGFPDQRFFSSAAANSSSKRIPLMISHGSWDPDYDYKPTLDFYRQIRKKIPSYPARYVLFETGKHGAPVRMIDWRDTLNWIDSL